MEKHRFKLGVALFAVSFALLAESIASEGFEWWLSCPSGAVFMCALKIVRDRE